VHTKPELVKPLIAKKPTIVNKALQKSTPTAFESTDTLNPDSRDSIHRLVSHDSVPVTLRKSVATSVQNLAMAQTANLIHQDNAVEYESNVEVAGTTVLNAVEESEVLGWAGKEERPELICEAELASTFMFEETVEVMAEESVVFEVKAGERREEVAGGVGLSVEVVRSFSRAVSGLVDGGAWEEACQSACEGRGEVVEVAVEKREEAEMNGKESVVRFNPVEMARGSKRWVEFFGRFNFLILNKKM